MCIYCLTNNYIAPTNFHPNINETNYDRILANKVHRSCLTIFEKYAYYVDASDQLQGYQWINFPMRLYLAVQNWWTKGKIEQDVIRKIKEAFNFILNINTSQSKSLDTDHALLGLDNTSFGIDGKFYGNYTSLAKKIIKKYSKAQHSDLYDLAHRILHERA